MISSTILSQNTSNVFGLKQPNIKVVLLFHCIMDQHGLLLTLSSVLRDTEVRKSASLAARFLSVSHIADSRLRGRAEAMGCGVICKPGRQGPPFSGNITSAAVHL
jgi:hypothetical protein